MLQPVKKLNRDIYYFIITSFFVQVRVWIMSGKSTMYNQPIINFKRPVEKCDPHFSCYHWIKFRCLIADRMPKMFTKNSSALSKEKVSHNWCNSWTVQVCSKICKGRLIASYSSQIRSRDASYNGRRNSFLCSIITEAKYWWCIFTPCKLTQKYLYWTLQAVTHNMPTPQQLYYLQVQLQTVWDLSTNTSVVNNIPHCPYLATLPLLFLHSSLLFNSLTSLLLWWEERYTESRSFLLSPQLAAFAPTARDVPELPWGSTSIECRDASQLLHDWWQRKTSILLHSFGVRVKPSDSQQNQISWVVKALSDKIFVTAAVTPWNCSCFLFKKFNAWWHYNTDMQKVVRPYSKMNSQYKDTLSL